MCIVMVIPIISLYRPFTYYITFEGTPRYKLWEDTMEKEKKSKSLIDSLRDYFASSNPNRMKAHQATDYSDGRSPRDMQDDLENIPKKKK